MDDTEYHMEEQYNGRVVVMGKTPFSASEEQYVWEFQSDNRKLLRIEWQNGRTMMYEGEAIIPADVQNYKSNVRGVIMSNRLFTMIKSFVIPILAIVTLLVVAGYALSGCQGGRTKSIQDRYPLESVAKEGKQESYVYRAANRSVPEVAKELMNEREPKQA